MYNYFQKIFLIFLFFSTSSVYAMENFKNNAAFVDAVIKVERNTFTQEDVQKIKECITKGANPNDIINYVISLNNASEILEENEREKTFIGRAIKYLKIEIEVREVEMTPAGFAVKYLNTDLLRCLIQCNADINKKDNRSFIPLKYAVDNWDNTANITNIIRELCNAGTSLIIDESPYTNNKVTAFHYLTHRKRPKEDIETIITHARFYDQAADEQLKKQIITSLLVFNRLPTLGFPKLPQEIRFRILSHLVLGFSSGFNERFRKKLIEMNCNDFIFPYVEKRIENIDKVLQFVDVNNMTPAQCWKDVNRQMHNNDAQYAAQVQSLLDGSKLRSDIIDFKNSFPNRERIPEDNLILKICDAQKLLEK